MPLVKVEEIYRKARQGGYAVSGFCVENLDMVLAILNAAEATRAPVVIVIWEADRQSVGGGYLEAVIRHGATCATVPVGIMLDHGTSLASCLQCIQDGHSAVMFDASHASLAENIHQTRQVCEIAHMLGALVEGELGTVRRSFESSGPYAEETVLTDPEQVASYVYETGVDALAISIGTESGIPSDRPRLDYDRLKAIAASTAAYLILHGGSGLSAEDVRQAVVNGVTAFRFASELRIAYLDALATARQALPPDFPDTRFIYPPARQAAQAVIQTRLEQMGCAGKAW